MKKLIGAILSLSIIVLLSSPSFATPAEDVLASMKDARGKLVALLDTTEKGTQTVLVNEIHAASDEADKRVDALIADAATPADLKAKATEAKAVWEEFKATREKEIIPAVLAGDAAKGKEIAMGIQKERFKKITALLLQ